MPERFAYSTAKGGIISLTKSAAMSLKRYNINANVIAPVAKTRMSAAVPFGARLKAPPSAFTNAATLISDEYRDTEDLDGLFSGYDADTATLRRIAASSGAVRPVCSQYP